MTRNEWIAETAREYNIHGKKRHGGQTVYESFADALEAAREDALTLEATTLAPWQSATPLPDAAAKVVEAAVAWKKWVEAPGLEDPDCAVLKLAQAVRAYKESAK